MKTGKLTPQQIRQILQLRSCGDAHAGIARVIAGTLNVSREAVEHSLIRAAGVKLHWPLLAAELTRKTLERLSLGRNRDVKTVADRLAALRHGRNGALPFH